MDLNGFNMFAANQALCLPTMDPAYPIISLGMLKSLCVSFNFPKTHPKTLNPLNLKTLNPERLKSKWVRIASVFVHPWVTSI